MNDTHQTTKMLQAILNGQSSTNQRIDKLDKKVDELRTELKTEIKEAGEDLTKRMDKIEQKIIPQNA